MWDLPRPEIKPESPDWLKDSLPLIHQGSPGSCLLVSTPNSTEADPQQSSISNLPPHPPSACTQAPVSPRDGLQTVSSRLTALLPLWGFLWSLSHLRLPHLEHSSLGHVLCSWWCLLSPTELSAVTPGPWPAPAHYLAHSRCSISTGWMKSMNRWRQKTFSEFIPRWNKFSVWLVHFMFCTFTVVNTNNLSRQNALDLGIGSSCQYMLKGGKWKWKVSLSVSDSLWPHGL